MSLWSCSGAFNLVSSVRPLRPLRLCGESLLAIPHHRDHRVRTEILKNESASRSIRDRKLDVSAAFREFLVRTVVSRNLPTVSAFL